MPIANNAQNLKKGYTLVEFVIVMAIVAVISGMVVTFSVLIGRYVGKNEFRTELERELTSIEKNFTACIAEYGYTDQGFSYIDGAFYYAPQGLRPLFLGDYQYIKSVTVTRPTSSLARCEVTYAAADGSTSGCFFLAALLTAEADDPVFKEVL